METSPVVGLEGGTMIRASTSLLKGSSSVQNGALVVDSSETVVISRGIDEDSSRAGICGSVKANK